MDIPELVDRFLNRPFRKHGVLVERVQADAIRLAARGVRRSGWFVAPLAVELHRPERNRELGDRSWSVGSDLCEGLANTDYLEAKRW